MIASVPRSGLWLLLGAFALLGLFAMHGLGPHGTHPGAMVESAHGAATSTTAASMGSGDHGSDVSKPAPLPHPGCDGPCNTSTTRHAGENPQGGVGVGIVICLAMLAAGVASLMFIACLQRPAVLRAAKAITEIAPLVRSARDRDPPCPFGLSVQRC